VEEWGIEVSILKLYEPLRGQGCGGSICGLVAGIDLLCGRTGTSFLPGILLGEGLLGFFSAAISSFLRYKEIIN